MVTVSFIVHMYIVVDMLPNCRTVCKVAVAMVMERKTIVNLPASITL